ncbi:MAG TPA: hypothetical protein VNI20_12490, partial [Fimbriimonadaceae bacterium]|nr:hypothetical protein [Fimbriimonadaceae bacterium]
GDLPDHVLATLSSVVASTLAVRIAFRRGVGHVVRPGAGVTVDHRTGGRVSLLPLTRCEGVVLQGVAWPLDGHALEHGGLVSVSNEASAKEVTAKVTIGTALLFVETDAVSW